MNKTLDKAKKTEQSLGKPVKKTLDKPMKKTLDKSTKKTLDSQLDNLIKTLLLCPVQGNEKTMDKRVSKTMTKPGRRLQIILKKTLDKALKKT